jgi:hypothetical protein
LTLLTIKREIANLAKRNTALNKAIIGTVERECDFAGGAVFTNRIFGWLIKRNILIAKS